MEAPSDTVNLPVNPPDYWGAELPGIPLNYFADRLPAAYFRLHSGKGPEDFPVLRRSEVDATIRREAFACAVENIRHEIGDAITNPFQPWCGLPEVFEDLYDRKFHRRLLAVSMSLWDRMSAGTFTAPWCTAEEILLGRILIDYGNRIEISECLDPGYVNLDALWLQDDDYLMLYSLEVEGRDEVLESLSGPPMYSSYLDFDSWFKPFRKSNVIPGMALLADVREFSGLPRFRWSD